MRILYDYQTFTFQKYGGISSYFCEIIRRLKETQNVVLGFKLARSTHVQDAGLKSCVLERKVDRFIESRRIGKRVWLSLWIRTVWNINRVFFGILLLGKKYDVFHITYDMDTWAIRWLGDKPFVYTVHDLIPELYYSPYSRYHCKRKWLATRASRIIAVSENTKNDLVRLWDIPAEKVDVIYHGVSAVDTGVCKWHDHGPYVLYVGGRGGYKNFSWFIGVMSKLLAENPALKLLCTGGPFSQNEQQELTRLGIRAQCESLFVDPGEMFDVYRNARCFVYPSEYEGFGIPILDAFKAGCPVVLSNASCFPEVAQDAAAYFNLRDEEGCRLAVKNFVYDDNIRKVYIERGFARVQQFSWETAASKTLNVYQKVSGLSN